MFFHHFFPFQFELLFVACVNYDAEISDFGALSVCGFVSDCSFLKVYCSNFEL